MIGRNGNLQAFIDLAQRAIESRWQGPSFSAAHRVFERIKRHVGDANSGEGDRLPVCGHLDTVYANMSAGGRPMPEFARSFAAIEGQLRWTRRTAASPDNQPFYDGHANAMLIGPGGLEQREDVMVGISLMAPHIRYVDHSHPPEEVYLAFTDGEWWNAAMPWTEPGPGGLIYNPPGIMHAMRSGEKPFLALWLLPVG